MNKRLGLELIGYGLLLAGLSYATHRLAPALAKPALVTGMLGGALSLLWGILALRGNRRKAGPLLTLIAIAYVLLSQTVLTWGGRGPGGSGSPMAPVVMLFLLATSFGMLIRIAYAGARFDGQSPRPRETPPTAAAGSDPRSNATRRA